MDLEEIETINLRDSSLAFSCRWSEDNHLSILSENEVHILQLKPIIHTSDVTVNLYRQTIKPRDQYPSSYFNSEVQNLICKEERLNTYNMINDTVLTPDGKTVECIDVIPRSALCCWSPADVVDGSRCALLFLNSVGNIDIQISQGQFWVVAVDLTALYVEHISSTWEGDCHNYDVLKSRCYQIATSAADWSPKYGEMSYVVLGQCNGDVLVWKIDNFRGATCEVQPILQTAFMTTSNVRLTAVHWIQSTENSALIITASLNGVIKIHFIENLQQPSVMTSTSLWADEDKIRVDQINSERIKNSNGDTSFLIIAAKQSNLVIFLVSENGEIFSKCAKRVGHLAITGLEHITTCKYVITTMTSYLGYVNITLIKNQIEKVAVSKIETSINCTYLSTSGICCSKNRALWFVTANYCKLINHLIIREPLQVMIYYDRLNFNNIKETFFNNPAKELGTQWDSLELFRLLTEKGLKIFEFLENYDDVELYHLKMHLWMSIFFETAVKRKKRDYHPLPAKDLKILVMIKYCIQRLDTDEHYETVFQKQSLRAMREYLIEAKKLEVFNQLLGEKTASDVERVIKKTDSIKLGDNKLTCSFCEAIVFNGKCLNGHRDNVCVVSLVSFSDLRYRTCPICSSVVHPEFNSKRILCTYCDVPFVFTDYKLINDV